MALGERDRAVRIVAKQFSLLLFCAHLVCANRYILKLTDNPLAPGMAQGFEVPEWMTQINGTVQVIDPELRLVVVDALHPPSFSEGDQQEWDIMEEDHEYYIQQLDDAATSQCARSVCKGKECTPYGIVMTGATDPIFNKITHNSDHGVTVCIVDSGLNRELRDIDDGLLAGCDDPQQCQSPWDSDDLGHGTHVAGTIAALRNNYGIVGVVPGGARLYVVKVVNPEGKTNASQIVQALGACETELRAQQSLDPQHKLVINLSLGGPNASAIVHTKIQRIMENNDTLIISSTGNNEDNETAQLYYPAGWPEVISVTAVDCNELRADFSLINDQVDIAAPGVNIVSTWPTPVDHPYAKLFVQAPGVRIQAVDVLPVLNAGYGSVTSGLVDCGLGGEPCPTTAKQRICLMERGGGVFFCEKVWNCMKGGGKAAIIFGNDTTVIRPKLSCNSTIAQACQVGVTCPEIIPDNYVPAVFILNTAGVDLRDRVKASKTPIKATVSTSMRLLNLKLKNGTSMACPHVSGVAAKLWNAFRGCGSSDVREALISTAKDLGPEGRDDMYGSGLLRARAAAEYLLKLPCAGNLSDTITAQSLEG